MSNKVEATFHSGDARAERPAAIDAPERRNPHCSNCGNLRGGPMGHETSECTFVHSAR